MLIPDATTSSGSRTTVSIGEGASVEMGENRVTGAVWMRAYVVEDTSWNLMGGEAFASPEIP